MKGLKDLARHGSLFRSYPYILAQECCSLGAFFVSYEWVKDQTIGIVREHVDPSGDNDMLAWASAASAAGMVLVAVGIPFENVLEWHAARRGRKEVPHSVVRHFLRDAKPRVRWRVLLSGMRRKLPLAPLAGLPLLAYEAMLHSGLAPVLHE